MHIDYQDIRNLTTKEPDWYDHNGTPRYNDYDPTMLGVYHHYALFAKILCQSCGKPFTIGEGFHNHYYNHKTKEFATYTTDDFHNTITNYHYGDPPAHGCCGDTMNCIDNHIIAAYHRAPYDWKRLPQYNNLDIMQNWAK